MPTGTETNFVNWLTTLGVGGVLAAFIFLLYRRDMKQYTDLWAKQSNQLFEVVKENTASNIKLIALIENKVNGKESGEVADLKLRLERIERRGMAGGTGGR